MNKFEMLALVNWAKDKNLSLTEAEAFEEVLKATGNETVAVELLLGMYEMPEISGIPAGDIGYKNSRGAVQYKDFNKFKNEVTYTYRKIPTKTAWTLKGQAPVPFELIEGSIAAYDANVLADELGITPTVVRETYEKITVPGPLEMEIHTDTCSLATWMNAKSR